MESLHKGLTGASDSPLAEKLDSEQVDLTIRRLMDSLWRQESSLDSKFAEADKVFSDFRKTFLKYIIVLITHELNRLEFAHVNYHLLTNDYKM